MPFLPPKNGYRLMAIILSNLNGLKNFTGRFFSKFDLQLNVYEIPPHQACVATLPCETLMSAKQAINDKLQGSVATYLRCVWIVNNRINKCLLLNLIVKKNVRTGEYLAKLPPKT